MEDLYKMILVDDEDEVRGRISSKISSESGFTVVGTAGNGYDAIELIEKHTPSVVLTDIKMPFIDGIELARIIKRDFPTVRVAFITGYDEFDYAREAVELHASSYLTKPVTQNDISAFLKRLKSELDNEFKEKYNIETLKKRYEASIPLIIDNYFISFLISSGTGHSGDFENLRQYGISLDESNYLLSFIRLDRSAEQDDIIEFEKLKLSVRSMICTIIEKRKYIFYSFMFNDGIVFLIKESGADFIKKIDQVFFEMIKMTEQFLAAGINIGVSNLHRNFSEMAEAYEEAENALGYSRFLNTGRIVYINELEEKKPRILSLSDVEIKQIEYAVRFGSEEELKNLLEGFKLAALRDNTTVTNYRLYIINLVDIAVRFADSIEADLNEITGNDIFKIMSGLRGLEQVFDWAVSVFIKLRKMNITTKMSNSQKMLDNAVNLINASYSAADISMESLCEELGISISYLSLLFKKHMQTTFVKYLTSVRLEKAKELLKLTEDRIIEVAGKCGYNDVYYFSHSFKKNIGVSPKKYREESNS